MQIPFSQFQVMVIIWAVFSSGMFLNGVTYGFTRWPCPMEFGVAELIKFIIACLIVPVCVLAIGCGLGLGMSGLGVLP